MNRPATILNIFALLLVAVLSSCHKSKKDEPKQESGIFPLEAKRVVLVYAVNKSSLHADFIDDNDEMLKAMEKVDTDNYKLLVYSTVNDTDCALSIPVKKSDGSSYEMRELKKYERNVTSTDPERIEMVITDALAMFPDSKFDLVFWGHGTSWYPSFSGHEPVNVPAAYSYGGEYNGYSTEWSEIDELASSIPAGVFDTIWFDCCYMSGIEVVYQFRNKCKNFVAYPTEVWQYGMEYNLMLPHLMQDVPDLEAAARAFYDFYNDNGLPVTVAVMNMGNIEDVAEMARRIVQSGPNRPASQSLLNYSRMRGKPLYDFRQLLQQTARLNGRDELVSPLENALGKFVTYHAESRLNFNYAEWNVDNICGINMHLYLGLDTEQEKYYRTLDWYNRVYR